MKLYVYTNINVRKHVFLTTLMFKLSENYAVDRRILKCDYIRYPPGQTSTKNTLNSQIYINRPRKASVFSL